MGGQYVQIVGRPAQHQLNYYCRQSAVGSASSEVWSETGDIQ